MKTKHIIATASATIIAGSLFFYLARRRRNNSMSEVAPGNVKKPGEEKIRAVMHHAKDIQTA